MPNGKPNFLLIMTNDIGYIVNTDATYLSNRCWFGWNTWLIYTKK